MSWLTLFAKFLISPSPLNACEWKGTASENRSTSFMKLGRASAKRLVRSMRTSQSNKTSQKLKLKRSSGHLNVMLSCLRKKMTSSRMSEKIDRSSITSLKSNLTAI